MDTDVNIAQEYFTSLMLPRRIKHFGIAQFLRAEISWE